MNTDNQSKFLELFKGKQVKFPHPITCFNPQEWTTITEINIQEDKMWIRGENTVWFNFVKCELKTVES